MPIYVAIDEGYTPTRLSSIEGIVQFSEGFSTEKGEVVTKKVAGENLRGFNSLRIYEFSKEELKKIEKGRLVRKDWSYIIHRI
ncbi:hypothetical protein [Vibrio crassostreae]|uniref:hypothetical protein n=1 Tax=Vibrio crassostreae TaxID=246167 RepID=UPI001B30B723|nr:hypothetical protein [Vibrio crassostreae]